MVDLVFKKEYVKLVAILTNKYGSPYLGLIEDAIQEAFYKAVKLWPIETPKNPAAWIMRVANNHLLDQLRKSDNSKTEGLDYEGLEKLSNGIEISFSEIRDDQLKMIFACCHPDITETDQLIISLKYLCGFGNQQIARALLKTPSAIEKALGRAKVKFRAVPNILELPPQSALLSRLDSVMRVIYLQFNEGYKTSSGKDLTNRNICQDAIRLAELLSNYDYLNLPQLNALIALMHFQSSRFNARQDEEGNIITLDNQNRSLWEQNHINQGYIYLGRAQSGDYLSIYHVEALIASYHCVSPSYEATNWQGIADSYDLAFRMIGNPIYQLNKLIALQHIQTPQETLQLYLKMEGQLPASHTRYIFAGNLYMSNNHKKEAYKNYQTALSLTVNNVEKQFIQEKMAACL